MHKHGVATVRWVCNSAVFLSVPVAISAHPELATGKPVQTRRLRFSLQKRGTYLEMSIKLMNAVWSEPTTSGSKRLILLALADNANDEGCCWPSLETIARKCNLSRRYVIDVIGELERDGLLVKTIRPGTSTMYKILVNYTSPPSEAGFTSGSEAGFTPLVRQGSLKPSINHQLEPPRIQEDRGLLELVERCTGLMARPEDVKVINEWERLGVIGDDIYAALQWRADNQQKPVKTIGQLDAGVKLNRAKRIQQKNGKKLPAGPAFEEIFEEFKADV